MTAIYPLSIQRRIEQKWAERLKSAAKKPAKVDGEAKTRTASMPVQTTAESNAKPRTSPSHRDECRR
jgi:hypothetical protein